MAVYDLKSEHPEKPRYRSTAKTGKHADPVWQVRWQPDDAEKKANFCSVSADGRVTQWTLVKNEIQHSDVITLAAEFGGDATDARRMESGTGFAFNNKVEQLFLVATEEGAIHKCSKAYSSKYLYTYRAHDMACYTVAWNEFHPRVFASCSAGVLV